LKVVEALAELAQIANANRIAFAPFDRRREILAANGNFDHVLDIANVDAVAGNLGPIDIEFDVRLADDPVSNNIRSAGHGSQDLLHLQPDLFDHFWIGSENLRAHHRAKARLQHDDASLDWLQP